MLTGETAAKIDASLQDFLSSFQDSRGLFGIAFVKQENRMDVAIASMEYVADAQLVFFANTRCPKMSGTLVRGTTPSCVQ